MSRIAQAQTLIRSLNPTPLRTSNSQQLNAALENITNRAFPNPANIAAGSTEERALDGMVKSLERLRAGKAMTDVCPSQSIYHVNPLYLSIESRQRFVEINELTIAVPFVRQDTAPETRSSLLRENHGWYPQFGERSGKELVEIVLPAQGERVIGRLGPWEDQANVNCMYH